MPFFACKIDALSGKKKKAKKQKNKQTKNHLRCLISQVAMQKVAFSPLVLSVNVILPFVTWEAHERSDKRWTKPEEKKGTQEVRKQ